MVVARGWRHGSREVREHRPEPDRASATVPRRTVRADLGGLRDLVLCGPGHRGEVGALFRELSDLARRGLPGCQLLGPGLPRSAAAAGLWPGRPLALSGDRADGSEVAGIL